MSKLKVDPMRVAETIVTPRTSVSGAGVTSPSKLQKHAQGQLQARSPKQPRTKAAIGAGSSARKTPQTETLKKFRVILLVLLSVLVGYGIADWRQGKRAQHTKGGVVAETSSRAEQQALRDRVSFHMNLTGGKLNRDRINVEVENQLSAPVLPTRVQPGRQPDVMSGLPMVAEPLHRQSSRDRLEASNPDFADSRIMYTLQEQQAANDWEDKARQQYIDEFVANAARAGYKVKVDSKGVVTVIGRSGAVEAGKLPRLPSNSGMAR